jgi:hypothetical protein
MVKQALFTAAACATILAVLPAHAETARTAWLSNAAPIEGSARTLAVTGLDLSRIHITRVEYLGGSFKGVDVTVAMPMLSIKF